MCELAMEIKRETEETIPVVSPCYFCWGWCYLLVVELSVVVVVVLFVVGGGGIICWWWCGGCAVTARVGGGGGGGDDGDDGVGEGGRGDGLA